MNNYEKIHNAISFEERKSRFFVLLSKYDQITLKQLNKLYEKKTFYVEKWKRDILVEFIKPV